jgi:hypothetical protein
MNCTRLGRREVLLLEGAYSGQANKEMIYEEQCRGERKQSSARGGAIRRAERRAKRARCSVAPSLSGGGRVLTNRAAVVAVSSWP